MSQVVFLQGDILERGADLSVLPCSAKGHISRTTEKHVHRYGLTLPRAQKLGEMDVHRFPAGGRITKFYAWAASVMDYRSDAVTIRAIGQKIAKYANVHPDCQVIESPLLGTGAGRLDPLDSGLALREGFLEMSQNDAILNIYGQIAKVMEQLRELNQSRVPVMAASGAASQKINLDEEKRISNKIRFAVALSFPGEYRLYVRKVVEELDKLPIQGKVFFDERYEAEIAGFDGDTILQKYYHDHSEMVVVFLCKEYEQKEWCCNVEWRAIRDLIKRDRARILPLRFDNSEIPGIYSIDICPDISKRTPKDTAKLIFERLNIVRGV